MRHRTPGMLSETTRASNTSDEEMIKLVNENKKDEKRRRRRDSEHANAKLIVTSWTQPHVLVNLLGHPVPVVVV